MRSRDTSVTKRRVAGLLVALLLVFRLAVACDVALAAEAAPVLSPHATADCTHPSKPAHHVPAAKRSCGGICPLVEPAAAAAVERSWNTAELHEGPEAAAANREIRPLVPPPQAVQRNA